MIIHQCASCSLTIRLADPVPIPCLLNGAMAGGDLIIAVSTVVRESGVARRHLKQTI